MKFKLECLKHFIENCYNGSSGAYSSIANGPGTLYATCYALMTKYYLADTLNNEDNSLGFVLGTQDKSTGYFVGPEINEWEPSRNSIHDREHVLMHLFCSAVLPVLGLFKTKACHDLKFAFKYLDKKYLLKWLRSRDWSKAWLEGNNLLFVGQFLIYLRDIEKLTSAQPALDLYFEWLDQEQDPTTGLWGTNGYCSNAFALYGGYHQLLVYYYENRPVRYPEQLIDVALSLQHRDGGFNPNGGGGACEDTDAIDILVNMYKRVDYKRPQIRSALRRALRHILQRQMPDGGFVYRLNQPFVHMGVEKTASGPNQSNMFSTWFRIHTLALISEILTDELISQINWKFNDTCSMGWHCPWNKSNHIINWQDRKNELLSYFISDSHLFVQKAYRKMHRLGGRLLR